MNLIRNTICLILLLSAIAASGYAQSLQTNLSREETIAYLKQKMAEAKNQSFHRPSVGLTYTMKLQSISGPPGAVKYSDVATVRPGQCEMENIAEIITFDPATIATVTRTDDSRSDTLGFMLVTLRAKASYEKASARYRDRNNGVCTNFGEVDRRTAPLEKFTVAFLKGDSNNFENIKNAFLRLRNLDEDEDDY